MCRYQFLLSIILINFIENEGSQKIGVSPGLSPNYNLLGISPINPAMANIVGSCLAFKEHLALLAENVTHCFVYNSRPFRVCTECLGDRAEFEAVYQNLTTHLVKDEVGNSCEKTLCYKDRIQVILKTKQYVDTMWSDAYCDNCYHNKSIAPDVEKFLLMINETLSCFENFTSTKLGLNDDLELSWKNATFNSSACTVCRVLYEDLSHFYENMDVSSKRKVCMDVVDRINVTRQIWSKNFNCLHFQPAWWWACWPLVTSLLATIVFYSFAILCCKNRQTTAVYRQKRLHPTGLTDGEESWTSMHTLYNENTHVK